MVCIIDDREDVWKMAPNLVHVRPYRFFDGTADINAPPEASKTDADDKETEGGVNIKTTQRNVRIVRLPKKPRDVSCVADTAEVDANTKNVSDNRTPSDSESKHDAVAVTVSATVTVSEQTGVNAPTECSLPVSSELVSETSASNDNSDCSSAVASSDNTGDHAVEHPSDKNEKRDTTVNKDTVTDGDGPESQPAERTAEQTEEYEEYVEWEDLDDYLVYLEDILRRIHSAYYELYDEMQLSGNAAPDLKNIVPYVRRKVLKGVRVVFSGVCPIGTDPATCRIYNVAESLGAVVQSSVVTGDVSEATTHLVAARPGTEKVKAASRQKNIQVVNPDWLWTCADRWEWVDERLYPLNDETSTRFLSRDSPVPTTKPKQKDSALNGGKTGPTTSKAIENNGGGSYSLVTLSEEDISGMDAEVDGILDEDSDSDEDDIEAETGSSMMKQNRLCGTEDQDATLRKQVLSGYCGGKRKYEDSSDEESLSGEFPKGWKISPTKRHKVSEIGDNLVAAQETDGEDDDDNEYNVKSDDSQSRISSSSETRDEDFDDSVGSANEEIAAAVEKEFLS